MSDNNKAGRLAFLGRLIGGLKKRTDHGIVASAMASKGDVRKVEGYDKMSACIDRLATIESSGKRLGTPVRTVREARESLLKNRETFEAAFGSGGGEAVRLVYANAVLALWHSVALICASGFDFEADGYGVLQAKVDSKAIEALKTSVPVSRLAKFVEDSSKANFRQSLGESATLLEREATLNEDFGITAALVAAGTVLVGLVLAARELAEYYFTLRGSWTKWLETQASFLEVNAAQLGGAKAGARDAQLAYARKFRALADRVRVESADAEQQVAPAIRSIGKESAPDPSPSIGALV